MPSSHPLYQELLEKLLEQAANEDEFYLAWGEWNNVVDTIWPQVEELLAQVIEYEHALEHIASDHPLAHPEGAPRCEACVQLAKGALERLNKQDCLKMIRDG